MMFHFIGRSSMMMHRFFNLALKVIGLLLLIFPYRIMVVNLKEAE